MGITDLADVVIFDIDVAMDKVLNKTEFYNIIGQQFNISKVDYES